MLLLIICAFVIQISLQTSQNLKLQYFSLVDHIFLIYKTWHNPDSTWLGFIVIDFCRDLVFITLIDYLDIDIVSTWFQQTLNQSLPFNLISTVVTQSEYSIYLNYKLILQNAMLLSNLRINFFCKKARTRIFSLE